MKALVRIAIALTLLAGVAHAQTPQQIAEAKKEYDIGQTAYDLAKYDEALAHYTKAFELSKLPALLFNLAQAHRRLYETGGTLENLRRARELYNSYLRLVPFSSERGLAETLLKGVEEEYAKQLHAQKDKLLIEAKGVGALSLAEDFLGQGDLDAAQAALERFQKSLGNKRAEVARGLRVKGRLESARGQAQASEDTFSRALELDPSTAPPPDSEAPALQAFGRASAKMKGKPALGLGHVPPTRLKIGAQPKLRVDVTNDTLGMVRGLELHYRAGTSAWAVEKTKPGEVTFPPTFNAGLAPGTRIEYWVSAVDDDGAVLDTLGAQSLPFVLHVDEKPPIPVHKRWQFWVGLGAGVVVAAGVAAAVGVTQAPPERTGIVVNNTPAGLIGK
jgi:tetratricopeptide (TPR) repeat protein